MTTHNSSRGAGRDAFNDLREYLSVVKEMGHLNRHPRCGRRVGDWRAHWDDRCAAQIVPSYCFDAIKGCPRGVRLMTNMLNNAERQKIIHGCPPELSEAEAARAGGTGK